MQEPERHAGRAIGEGQGPLRRAVDALDVAAARCVAALGAAPRLAAGVIVLLCLAALLPGLFDLPPIDRTEVRYAQASKQMLETGNFTAPRFQAEPQFTMPIGVYWLQALSAGLMGEAAREKIWAYRLPSFLGATLGVMLTFWGVRRLFGGEVAVVAAALLAVDLIIVVQAHLALTKAILFAFIAAAQWALARIYVEGGGTGSRRDAAIFWAAQGGGLLTGVFALPLLSLTTILGLAAADRSIGWLKGLGAHWGIPLALLLASPWLAAMVLNPDGELLRLAWAEAPWSRLAGPQEMNWRAPPGIFLLGLWLGALPAVLFLPAAAGGLWLGRESRARRFLLVWVVAYLVALEVLSAKPPLYTLQALMPALFAAVALTLVEGTKGPIGRLNAGVSLFAGLIPVVALGAIIWLMSPPVGVLPIIVWIGLAGASLLAVYAARRARPFAAFAAMLGAAVLFYVGGLGLTLPRFDRVWTSARLAEAAGALETCAPGPVAVAGYAEPSAVFLLGTTTHLGRGSEAGAGVARWLGEGRGARAFVTARHDAGFRAVLDTLGKQGVRKVGCVQGLNFGKFEWITLGFYTTTPAEALTACPVPARFRCPDGAPMR